MIIVEVVLLSTACALVDWYRVVAPLPCFSILFCSHPRNTTEFVFQVNTQPCAAINP